LWLVLAAITDHIFFSPGLWLLLADSITDDIFYSLGL